MLQNIFIKNGKKEITQELLTFGERKSCYMEEATNLMYMKRKTERMQELEHEIICCYDFERSQFFMHCIKRTFNFS